MTQTLKKHSLNAQANFTEAERAFLEKIVAACRNRNTFRFQFPKMSPVMYKYTSRSEEYNIVNVLEEGSGRRGTVYAFDYCYCLAKDVPTHYIGESEKLNRDRSLQNGRWIPRVARISQAIMDESAVQGKITGIIDYLKGDKGFIRSYDGMDYFFVAEKCLIDEDRKRPVTVGMKVRFYPSNIGEANVAWSVELL